MLNSKRLIFKSVKHRGNLEPVSAMYRRRRRLTNAMLHAKHCGFRFAAALSYPTSCLAILHKCTIVSLLLCLYLLLPKVKKSDHHFRPTDVVPIYLIRILIAKLTCVSSNCFLPAAPPSPSFQRSLLATWKEI